MFKKISYDDAAFILNWKHRHFFEHYCCRWFLRLNNGNEGYLEGRVNPFIYGLFFLPECLLCFLYCLWDGGIREFEFPSFVVHSYVFCGLSNEGSETIFGRMKIIYNKAA